MREGHCVGDCEKDMYIHRHMRKAVSASIYCVAHTRGFTSVCLPDIVNRMRGRIPQEFIQCTCSMSCYAYHERTGQHDFHPHIRNTS